MKTIIKKIIKSLIPKQRKTHLQRVRNLSRKYKKGFIYTLFHINYIPVNNNISPIKNVVNQSITAFKKIKLKIDTHYIYPYDPLTILEIPEGYQPLASVTVDYSTVLKSSLNKIEQEIKKCSNTKFVENELLLIKAIRNLNEKIITGLHKRKDKRGKKLIMIHKRMLDNQPNSFDEAIAKILFYNALFWQSNHLHNGLGRLDMILYPYYKNDLLTGKETKESLQYIIKEFISILARDFKAKSLGLLGDTGQYILIGGIDQEGKNIQNELTEIFLEIFTEIKVPDPKLIMRVNKKTNDDIWTKAIKCIITGCGSPLIMNEKLIMDSMVNFGYDEKDVWNVGTSACWEPLIIGKSLDQNNPFPNIVIIESINEIIINDSNHKTFESFLEKVKKHISEQIKNTVHDLNISPSPIYTLFFDNCIKKELDFTMGGAKYNYHGIQICSFPNFINALLNINRYVYKENLITLEQCKNAILANYEGQEDIRKLMLSNNLKFGSTNAEVIELTNKMMSFISKETEKHLVNGNNIKVGFSSSEYINLSRNIKATIDGRYNFEPFAVHISPLSNKIDIQEIIEFAGSLNYSSNRMNGNVVDFILPTSYERNQEKLISILKIALTSGVYELQLNVLDVNTLKDAKQHPEKYPNLIVRVWGFSAYFNDLPEEYKDNLIKRAENYAA